MADNTYPVDIRANVSRTQVGYHDATGEYHDIVTAETNAVTGGVDLVAGGTIVPSNFGTLGIVAIGDSRSQYCERTTKTAALTMTNVIGIGVLDYCASQTGSLQYEAGLGFRFSASGTSQYGEYVPVKQGILIVPDSNGIRIKLGVKDIPSDATVAVTIGGSAISAYGSRGITAWAARYLNSVLPLEVSGIGGLASSSLNASMENIIASVDSPKQKIAVVLIGTNDVSEILLSENVAGIVQNCVGSWTKALAGFKSLVIIEETARFVSGSSIALGAVPQSLIRAINTAARNFQQSNQDRVRYVSTLDWMCDPAASTFQPRTGVLDDGVHPAQLTCQVIGARVAEAIQSFANIDLPANMWAGVSGNFDGSVSAYGGTVGNQVGSGGTVAAGFSGTLSTGWTSVRQSGSDTLALSKVARTDIPGSEWLQAVASSTAGASQWDVKTVAVTISSLGLAVGDTVQFAHELAIDTATLLGPVETVWRFVEPNMYAGTTATDGTIKVTGAHGVLWYSTPEIVIPAGSVTIEFRARVDVNAASASAQVRLGRLVYKKI